MSLDTLSFDLANIQAAYHSGESVRSVIAEAMRRCATECAREGATSAR